MVDWFCKKIWVMKVIWLFESVCFKNSMDDITYSSFVLQVGYKHHFSASDIVYCVTAFLENNVSTITLNPLLCSIFSFLVGNRLQLFECFRCSYQVSFIFILGASVGILIELMIHVNRR